MRERDRPVVVARAATMEQAIVLRSALQAGGVAAYISGEQASSWMPHMTLALNPRGIEVLARGEDAARAREVLGRGVPGDAGSAWRQAPGEVPAVAEEYAARAGRAALFQILFPPMILLVPYYCAKALSTAKVQPPADARRFRRDLRNALIVSAPFALLYVFVLLAASGAAEVVGGGLE